MMVHCEPDTVYPTSKASELRLILDYNILLCTVELPTILLCSLFCTLLAGSGKTRNDGNGTRNGTRNASVQWHSGLHH